MVENEITSTANIPISEIKRNIGIFSFEEKIEDNQHFARALKFADVEFKKELEDYILHAKETRYKSASDYMKLENYSLAIKEFEQAGDYNDSQEQIKICHEKIEAKNKEKLKFKNTKEKEIKKGIIKTFALKTAFYSMLCPLLICLFESTLPGKRFVDFSLLGCLGGVLLGIITKLKSHDKFTHPAFIDNLNENRNIGIFLGYIVCALLILGDVL